MFSLEKIQENAQEVSERFAHLVTFGNTYGLNGKDIRISLPKKYNRIALFGVNFKVVFNESNLILIFKHKPTDNSIAYISELSNEVKYNNKLLNWFRKSSEDIRLQFLPNSDENGSIIEWKNVKLIKISNQFIQTETESNVLETKLTFSYRKINHKYLSPIDNNIDEKIQRTNKLIEDLKNKKKESNNIKQEGVVPELPKDADLLKEECKWGKFPNMEGFAYITKLEKELFMNSSEKGEATNEEICKNDNTKKSKTTNEEICKTDNTEKSEHESTKEKTGKQKKRTKKSKK